MAATNRGRIAQQSLARSVHSGGMDQIRRLGWLVGGLAAMNGACASAVTHAAGGDRASRHRAQHADVDLAFKVVELATDDSPRLRSGRVRLAEREPRRRKYSRRGLYWYVFLKRPLELDPRPRDESEDDVW